MTDQKNAAVFCRRNILNGPEKIRNILMAPRQQGDWRHQ